MLYNYYTVTIIIIDPKVIIVTDLKLDKIVVGLKHNYYTKSQT